MVGLQARGDTWDISSNFSTTNNPSGAWTYGWVPSLGGTFSAYTACKSIGPVQDFGNTRWWVTSGEGAAEWDCQHGSIYKNMDNSASYGNSGIGMEPYMVLSDSPYNDANKKCVARWTSPINGILTISSKFTGQYNHVGVNRTESDIWIVKNNQTGSPVFNGHISGYAGLSTNSYTDSYGTNPVVTYSGSITINLGDTVDFVVASSRNWNGDVTGLAITLTSTSNWDLGSSFSTSSNPNGLWSYGWLPSIGGTFTTFSSLANSAPTTMPDTRWWVVPGEGTSVWDWAHGTVCKNLSGSTNYSNNDAVFLEAGMADFYAGSSSRHTAIRWTAPFSCAVEVNGRFTGQYNYLTNCNADVHIAKNGTSFYNGHVNGFAGKSVNNYTDSNGTSPVQTYIGLVSVNSGDVIDFINSGTGAPFLGVSGSVTAVSTGTISGTVTANMTGHPAVAGALVARSDGYYLTTSASNGTYSMTVPSGVWTFTASNPLYTSVTASNVTVPANGTLTQNFDLGTATVSGTVTSNEAGHPAISGATVKTLDGVYSTTTATNGTYTINVPTGTYTVYVTATGHSPQKALVPATAGSVSTQNYDLRLLSGTVLTLPIPVEWAEPAGSPTAPGDAYAVSFSDTTGSVNANAPVIAEWNKTALPNETFTLSGIKFTNRAGSDLGSDTTVWIWAQDASGGTLRQAKIWRVTSSQVTACVPSDLPFGMYLVWVENDAGASAPVCLNRPDSLWIGPMGSTAQAGATKRIFGKNVAASHGTANSYVYVQPAAGGALTACTVTAVEPYAVTFTVPGGLSNGNYRVYLQSGHGGQYGWSDPLSLTVASAWSRGGSQANLTPSGGDDTAAIQAAIDSMAAQSNGGTVNLSAGTFRYSTNLTLKSQVKLQGAGMNQTTLECHPYSQDSGYFCYTGNHPAIQDITLKMCSDTYLLRYACMLSDLDYATTDFRLTNVRWNGDAAAQAVGGWIYTTVGEITGCESNGQVIIRGSDVWAHSNTFNGGPYAVSEAAIEDGGDRFVLETNTFQTNWPHNGSNYNYLLPDGNVDTSVIPGGQTALNQMVWAKRLIACSVGNSQYIAHNSSSNVAVQDNKGEMILYHAGTGIYFGNVISNNGTTMTVRTDGLVDGQDVWLDFGAVHGGQPIPSTVYVSDVIIMSGTGQGQRRTLVGHTSNTMTVDSLWRIAPDSTSKVVLTKQYRDEIVYANDLNAFPAGYVQTYSASCGPDIDGNGWNVSVEGNTSHRTFGSRQMQGYDTGPTFWCENRNEKAYDTYVSMTRTGWGDNILGPPMLGSAFHNVEVDRYGSAGANNWGWGYAYGDGVCFEGCTFSGGDQGFNFGSEDVICRNNTMTLISTGTPNYFSMTNSSPILLSNTYSGATSNYYGVAGYTFSQKPLPEYRVARFTGYVGASLSEVTIPVANAGKDPLSWTVTPGQGWISAYIQQNPTVAPEGETGELAIAVNTSTLSAGVTWGYVTITSANGISLRVGVRVELTNGVPANGLTLWLKSDTGITKDGSNYVGTWADQSGGGKNATQSTQGYKPLWVSGVVSGYPAIRFAGTDDVLKTASGVRPFDGTTQFSTFTVNKWNSFNLTNSYQRIWWEGSTSGTNGYGEYIDSAASPKIKAGWGSATAVVADPNTETLGKWYQTSTIYNATNQQMWINGTSMGTAAKTNSNINAGVLNVGNYSTNNQGFNGDLTEILMYNRALSSTERPTVEGYLRAKYFAPNVSFTATPSSGDPPLSVSFDASASYDPTGSITSYSWRFGDGGSATGVTANHQYANPGSYTATLIVTDNSGASRSARQTITVNAPTAVSLGGNPASPIMPNATVTLTATPTGGVNREYKFLMDSGSGYTTLRDWAGSNTCNWTPTGNGTYNHKVDCREVGSGSGWQVESNVVSYTVRNYWSLSGDYSTTSNPNGAWSYGWKPDTAGTLTTFTLMTDFHSSSWWITSGESPEWSFTHGAVLRNDQNLCVQHYLGAWMEPYMVLMTSPTLGPPTKSTVRWTAPFTGPALIDARFSSEYPSANSVGNVYIVQNDATPAVLSSGYSGFAGTSARSYTDSFGTCPVVTYGGTINVVASDKLDFLNQSAWNGSFIGLNLTIYAAGTASGVVRGNPGPVTLSNALVQVVGGTQYTYTDSNGNYTLKLPIGATTLRASKTGYQNQDVNTNVFLGATTVQDFLLNP